MRKIDLVALLKRQQQTIAHAFPNEDFTREVNLVRLNQHFNMDALICELQVPVNGLVLKAPFILSTTLQRMQKALDDAFIVLDALFWNEMKGGTE